MSDPYAATIDAHDLLIEPCLHQGNRHWRGLVVRREDGEVQRRSDLHLTAELALQAAARRLNAMARDAEAEAEAHAQAQADIEATDRCLPAWRG
jgi:hypothetical protein